jgi:site-specific recombinase XerD
MAKAFLATYVYGGLRSKEVRELRVQDVSFEGQDCMLAVRYGKGQKRRVVPFHREGIPFIRDWMEERPPYGTDSLFVSDKRRPMGERCQATLWREIKWLARIDRPELKMHSLRHAYGTRKLADGVNLYHIKELLGHSNIQTTINYLHSDLSQLKEAAQRGGLHQGGEQV